jgi:type VI protein secretion system component Hcp
MAIAPIVIFYDSKGNVIPGPVKIKELDSIYAISSLKQLKDKFTGLSSLDQLKDEFTGLSGCYIYEFTHHVYTVSKDYFYALLHGQDFVRKHEPMMFVKNIDQISPYLLNYMKTGAFLSKIEIRWYQYSSKKGKQEEYFRMTLENVRLHKVHHTMPDVKDPRFERYNHLEEVQFKFRKINWLYFKGHLSYTDVWNDAFGELYDDDYFKEEDPEEPVAQIAPLELKFISGEFDDSQDIVFNKRIKIKFSFKNNRRLDNTENKVFAKLFCVYKGKTEDLSQIAEGRLIAENSWTTDFKLSTPTNYIKGDAVEYFAVIENRAASNDNFKSDTLALPFGYVHVNLGFYNSGNFEKDIICIISNEKGKKYSSRTDNKGDVLWKVSKDSYTLSVKYKGENYTSPVEWQQNDKEIQKIEFRKNNFIIDGDTFGGGNVQIHVDYLKTDTLLVGKKCIVNIYEDSNPQIIAKFEVIIKEKSKDSYCFSEVVRIDEFQHQLPAPDTQDKEGNKYLEPLKYKPSHFYLTFDSDKKEKFVIIMPFEPENKAFAVYTIRYVIELDGDMAFNSKEDNPLHSIDCNKILIDNLRDAVIFIIGNHYKNVLERSCGTHYGGLYPYSFKNEAEYLEAARRGGFSLSADRFKGTWDQSIKNKFEVHKKQYKLKKTDCITFILEVMEIGFNKTCFGETWKKCKKAFASVTGHELAFELLKLNWVALFYTPDSNNFYGKDADILKLIYEMASKEKIYGTNILKPILPVEDLVINYKPTMYDVDKKPIRNPTKFSKQDQEKLEKVMKLPFAFLIAEYGQHTALLIEGSIYGVHWSESPYSDFLYETDHRKFTSERRENSWGWSNGVIITPKMFWKD